MARDKITVQEPVLDAQKSTGTVEIAKQAVTVANGIELQLAFEEKDNSVYIFVENTAASKKAVTLKAGNSYPNKMLGDKTIEITASKTACIMVQDLSRYERKDGSVYIDFATGFTGNIWVVGKHAGIYLAA